MMLPAASPRWHARLTRPRLRVAALAAALAWSPAAYPVSLADLLRLPFEDLLRMEVTVLPTADARAPS
jgi:hypothetical protein